MKPLPAVLGAAWLLTLGAAFLVGQKSTSHSDPDAESRATAPVPGPASRLASKSSRDGEHSARDSRGGPSHSLRGEAGRLLAGAPPRQAVVDLTLLDDPIERAKGFLALIDHLQADEFRDVVADFRSLGLVEERMSEYGMLLHAWGQLDPVGALGYAMEHTGSPFARQTILASWASKDPDAAIAFARENHKGDEANPLMVGVIRGLAPNDLPRATELLQSLPYSRERGEALQTMLPFVMDGGVDQALTWTNSIADSQLKSGAISFIMSDLSESQPKEAAERLAVLEDNTAVLRVANDVAGSLARADLEHAIVWSESLQPDVRAEAVQGIVSHYASQDPRAAAQWLDTLAGTTNLDSAIQTFASTAQHSDPQLAAEWIGRIQDERGREKMYHGVLHRWWGSDPAGAEQWIHSAPDLPEAIRQLPAQWQSEARIDPGGHGRQ